MRLKGREKEREITLEKKLKEKKDKFYHPSMTLCILLKGYLLSQLFSLFTELCHLQSF